MNKTTDKISIINNLFGLVLMEKECTDGLNRDDIMFLFKKLNSSNIYPIEFPSYTHKSSAMGFITKEAANKIDYDYEDSGLMSYITNILDDVENESNDNTYKFKGIDIWLSKRACEMNRL